MNDKSKFPAAAALQVAEEITRLLGTACERIEIAGSLRRLRPFVGDVEILYTPKFEERRDGLFDTVKVSLAEERIDKLLADGVLTKRPSKTGVFAWGKENKLGVHVASGISVDLFSTTEAKWHMSLVIRTGPKDFNIRLMQECRKNGLEGHAYGTFTKIPGGETVPVASEREVFTLAGIPWLEPEERR